MAESRHGCLGQNMVPCKGNPSTIQPHTWKWCCENPHIKPLISELVYASRVGVLSPGRTQPGSRRQQPQTNPGRSVCHVAYKIHYVAGSLASSGLVTCVS